MTGYHGTCRRGEWTLHAGVCLAQWPETAEGYATEWAGPEFPARVFEVELDLTGLNVVEAEAGDRDSATWAGDYDLESYAAAGADVITYEDEDYRGQSHNTYRLVSERAVAAAKVVAVEVLGDDEDED